MLTYIFLLPIVAALMLLFVPSKKSGLIKTVALVVQGIQLLLSLYVTSKFDKHLSSEKLGGLFQFVEKSKWFELSLGSIGSLRVDYHLGVDGISLPLVVLSTLILLIGTISSWRINEKIKGYFVLYLILNASIIGCFLALDFFLFYLCFEFMLLPMFFLIGIWGGERRSYASIKFFMYTLVGSLFILVVMIGAYLSVQESGSNTFSLIALMNGDYLSGSLLDPGSTSLMLGWPARTVAFLFLLIGFGIKLPMVPFHTWLPDAHVEAPTPISVILAGLLLKVGAYGFIRIGYAAFPKEAIELANWIGTLGVVSIIYGGLNALAQYDMKRIVAFSSIAHMGFVLLGLASITKEGLTGSFFQLISHGLISPALFIIVGVLYDRTHDRLTGSYSGLASKMPVYTFFVIVFFFAGLGLPGMSGFIGELLVLMGAFKSNLSTWVSIIALSGIAISAAYFLWTIQRVFFGKYFVMQESWQDQMQDLTIREKLMLIPLTILVVLLGVYPRILLDISDQTFSVFIHHLLNN